MENWSLTIRQEIAADATAIRTVLEQAFGRPAEADLVEALRCRDKLALSLVAIANGSIVGYIAFSPVTIGTSAIAALGLAPVAVLPAYQRRSIGSQLVCQGLAACQQAGYEVVTVLGHANFYERLGFEIASNYEIWFSEDVPIEAFRVKALRSGALRGKGGKVGYQPQFGSV